MRTARGVPLGRIAGISIRAHWSVLLVALLLAWGLATEILPVAGSALPPAALWGLAALGAVVLIGSLTLHELAHSLVARRRGLTVDGITLWLFGGVSQIHDDWRTPRTELLVAAAGPAVSLVLGGLFLGAAFLADRAGVPAIAVLLLQWLAIVNVVLLVFNLLPAFPLDGGRILRSLIWLIRGDRDAATRAAARGGRVVAALIAALAVADLLLTADVTGAVWLLLIAWFLDTTAKQERAGEQLKLALTGVRVGEAMSQPASVPSWLTVQLLLEQSAGRPLNAGFVTHGIGGQAEGLVTVQALRTVMPNRRATTRLSDIALPLAALPTAAPGDLLSELLPRLNRMGGGRALVIDQGQMVGMVSSSDVARVLARGHEAATPV
ncbi:MAG: site-2 protease family protein [Candidatus Dormibacteraeota bacterium]|nr:site-2 protease family protein [Candidatus Dormibacteraeota bacterium]